MERFRHLNHIDHATLLRGDTWLRDMAGASCRRLAERGAIDSDAARRVWDRHASGEDLSALLRRLVTLELAHEVWIEGAGSPRA